MTESILTSIKKLLGITEDYTIFDQDIMLHINTVMMTLRQIGVGPAEGFMIEDKTTIWGEYLIDEKKLTAVKTYIYLKVKILFDPPANSTTLEAFKQMADEYEWRLNFETESW